MPNQDPNQPITSSIPLVSVQQTDLPPLPPDFQDIPEEKPVAQAAVDSPTVQQPTDESVGSAAPSMNDISSIVKSPKKKFGTGKIIATILGIFLLVGGVGVGVTLTQQQQTLQPKAAGCSRCACGCVYNSDGTNSCNSPCATNPPSTANDSTQGQTCAYSCIQNNGACPAGSYSQQGSCNAVGAVCCKVSDSANTASGAVAGCVFDNYKDHNVCVELNGTWQKCEANPTGEMGVKSDCKTTAGFSCSDYTGGLYPSCVTGGYCINTSQSCTPAVPTYANCVNDATCGTTTTTTTTSSTPTPTPTSTAPYCVAVKAYDSSWTSLTSTELSALTTGSVVNFCVAGSAPSGTFDMAQFTIDGTQLATTTTQRPSSTDYCQSYTILSTDTTVTVTAKIHHSTLGWF